MRENRFLAHASRAKPALSLLCSLALVAASAWRAIDPPLEGHLAWRIAGTVGLLFFAYASLVTIRELGVTAPAVEIGLEGITWPRLKLSLSWHDIVRVEELEVRRRKVLALRISETAARQHSKPLDRAIKTNRATGHGDLVVCVTNTNRSFDELVDAIRRCAPGMLAERD